MINRIKRELASIDFKGYASGLGDGDLNAQFGPEAFFAYLTKNAPSSLSNSLRIIYETPYTNKDKKIEAIAQSLTALNEAVALSVEQRNFFTVIGGDHSSGICTWSTLAHQLDELISLIWINGHLDAHTYHSSHSKNVHGMPVANLLGFCDLPELKPTKGSFSAIEPEHLYLIGARSYEKEEVSLLKDLGVKVYFVEDVLKQGINSVLNEVTILARTKTNHFGISIDIDAFDYSQMPGTGLHMENGLCVETFINALEGPPLNGLVGLEIAEYNPKKEHDFITSKRLITIIDKIHKESFHLDFSHF